jgi:hypothetical protein
MGSKWKLRSTENKRDGIGKKERKTVGEIHDEVRTNQWGGPLLMGSIHSLRGPKHTHIHIHAVISHPLCRRCICTYNYFKQSSEMGVSFAVFHDHITLTWTSLISEQHIKIYFKLHIYFAIEVSVYVHSTAYKPKNYLLDNRGLQLRHSSCDRRVYTSNLFLDNSSASLSHNGALWINLSFSGSRVGLIGSDSWKQKSQSHNYNSWTYIIYIKSKFFYSPCFARQKHRNYEAHLVYHITTRTINKPPSPILSKF